MKKPKTALAVGEIDKTNPNLVIFGPRVFQDGVFNCKAALAKEFPLYAFNLITFPVENPFAYMHSLVASTTTCKSC